ncbi:hypothetical protein N2152v2_006484 [Parachlorella kessleri]
MAAVLLLTTWLAALPLGTQGTPSPPAAAPLAYGILLSGGSDAQDSKSVPWGSYHVTIAGYHPCQSLYPNNGNCTKPSPNVVPGCDKLDVTKMYNAAEAAWKAANKGSTTYQLPAESCDDPGKLEKEGGLYRAVIHDKGGTLRALAEGLCSRGFADAKGPEYASSKCEQHAAGGKQVRLWLVPCHVDGTCSASAQGCPCGKYNRDGSAKPSNEQWQQIM